MYTDEQKRRHIYDLQVCLRRIQQENDHPQPLVPDGIFGAETAEAVRAHQRQNGLPVSGQVDRATWDSIFDTYEQLTALDALPAAVRFFPAEGGVLSPGDFTWGLRIHLITGAHRGPDVLTRNRIVQLAFMQ